MSLSRKKFEPTFKEQVADFSNQLTRTKSAGQHVETNLRRCLTLFDVTLLSLGHMVGAGVYVLAPAVAKNDAGPAIVISFLIAGFASFLAALCYAELGVRYPRAGLAYSYTYLALGELWAFLVGWNVALENVIGVAAIARACSVYVDGLAGKVIHNRTNTWLGTIDGHIFFDFDFLSLAIIVLFLIIMSFGVKMTAGLNNVFCLINLSAIGTIILVGANFADVRNWRGGFMPYGWEGVFKGAATCFYAYVGFDVIAASGEEAKNPTRTIPLATIISMSVATTLYMSVGAVLTLMINYKDIVHKYGITDALKFYHSTWSTIVVSIGAICGMSTGIIGFLFALTRVIYVMADDGLLLPFCARINDKTQTPLQAMYIFGGFAAVMTFCLGIEALTKLMSIGSLFAYLVVSSSLIVIRYRPIKRAAGSESLHWPLMPANVAKSSPHLGKVSDMEASADFKSSGRRTTRTDIRMQSITEEESKDSLNDSSSEEFSSEESISNDQRKSASNPEADISPPLVDPAGQMYERFAAIDNYLKWRPGLLVIYCVFFFVVFVFLACFIVRTCREEILSGTWWADLLLFLALAGVILCFVLIMLHQESNAELDYKVPCAPLTPALSIAIDAWLIAHFKFETFLRLFIWIIIGLLIYIPYGRRHSVLNRAAPPQGTDLDDLSREWFAWGKDDSQKKLHKEREEQKKKEKEKEDSMKPSKIMSWGSFSMEQEQSEAEKGKPPRRYKSGQLPY